MCTYFLRDERKNTVIDAAREYVILEEKWQSGKGMFIGVGNVDKAGAALREAIKRLDTIEVQVDSRNTEKDQESYGFPS